jgi:uncharacterized membrane protein
MALANLGYLPPHPPEVDIVFKYILPLAIPMLLLSANVFRILRETGPLLLAFLLGTAATVASSYLGKWTEQLWLTWGVMSAHESALIRPSNLPSRSPTLKVPHWVTGSKRLDALVVRLLLELV